MQQVLLNLYSNALKFTGRDGKITIMIEKFESSMMQPKNYADNLVFPANLRLTVIDTGTGIKDEDQPKIFKLFSSIKDEKKKLNVGGIGLGLVISKMIVEKFNGHIDFISKYEEGSTFYFTFEIFPVESKDYADSEKARERTLI